MQKVKINWNKDSWWTVCEKISHNKGWMFLLTGLLIVIPYGITYYCEQGLWKLKRVFRA